MTELTKILGKSYDNADFQNFFRKSYENVTKNLRKIYDHNLAILSWPFETQINTSFYAKPVRKKKLIKTSAVFKTPWRIQREINNGMCCHLTPSIVLAAVNGHIINIFQVELAM